jgi:hypothetical protein
VDQIGLATPAFSNSSKNPSSSRTIALVIDDRLGHRLGWRFLYTPARTLAPDTRLAFVALNPGDGAYHCPILSVEQGDAYRIEIEDWWGARQQQGLQTQVRLLTIAV